MLGPKQEAQGALFYESLIEDHVPQDHLLRSKDRHGRFRDSDLLRHLFKTTVARFIPIPPASGLQPAKGTLSLTILPITSSIWTIVSSSTLRPKHRSDKLKLGLCARCRVGLKTRLICILNASSKTRLTVPARCWAGWWIARSHPIYR